MAFIKVKKSHTPPKIPLLKFFYSILQTIGYNHRFAYLNEIYFNYISQLEFMGLWTWSIYVLLHLPESQLYVFF